MAGMPEQDNPDTASLHEVTQQAHMLQMVTTYLTEHCKRQRTTTGDANCFPHTVWMVRCPPGPTTCRLRRMALDALRGHTSHFCVHSGHEVEPWQPCDAYLGVMAKLDELDGANPTQLASGVTLVTATHGQGYLLPDGSMGTCHVSRWTTGSVNGSGKGHS